MFEREQHKLLQAHYVDAIPLHLLKEDQSRIGKALKNISDTMDAYQAEYADAANCFDLVFELLDDCGRAYKLADDFPKRCFNQALFEKIRVYDDLRVEADYAEPFDTLLDPAVLELKHEFEKKNQGKRDGQPESEAHLSLMEFLSSLKVQTRTNIADFFGAGLSKDCLAPSARIERATYRLGGGRADFCRVSPGALQSPVTRLVPSFP